MALTVEQLAVELRIIPASGSPLADGHRETLTRLLQFAAYQVDLSAHIAPVVVRDQATIVFAGYVWDRPLSNAGPGYANAWRNSRTSGVARHPPSRHRSSLLTSDPF